jgi:signal transduction histidine kinase
VHSVKRIWRKRTHRPQSAFIVVLLLLTLGLAALLAQQAHQAARSHRTAAESTLRDYAAFAAWKFANAVRGEMLWMFNSALKSFGHPDTFSPEHTLPEPAAFAAAMHAMEKPEYISRMVRSYFFLDLHKGKLVMSGTPVPEDCREWVRDTLAVHARTFDPSWTFAALVRNDPESGDSRLFVYTPVGDWYKSPRAALGFEVDLEALRTGLAMMVEKGGHLPPALIGSLPTDSVMSIKVKDASGLELFRSTYPYPTQFSAVDTVGKKYGDLEVHVALRPRVAEQLVIGGLPKSRLPLLLGLLGLTAGLVGITLLQHRREYELAGLRAEFVSNVSHELRTPLAQIRMFAETLILGRVRSPAEHRRSLEIIDQEARRLTHLVENVLLFSRAERQAIRLAPEPTDLTDLIREVVDGFLPLALARQVSLRTELRESLVVCVDRNAMCQVLLNLIDNAVKYGPEGQTVTIATSATGGRVRIWVEDQGPGIPPKDRRRIWERFSRLDREKEAAVAGTGIGLAVVWELTAQHGGRAWVEEALGGGARFIVEVPGAERVSGGPDELAGAVAMPRDGTEAVPENGVEAQGVSVRAGGNGSGVPETRGMNERARGRSEGREDA